MSTKANALMFWGRLGEAHQTVTAGIELSNRNENAPWLGILLATRAWLHWEAHDFDGLEALATELEQSATTATGSPNWLRATANVAGMTVRVLQGFADLERGRHDQALGRFIEIHKQQARPKFGLSWHRRLFTQLGLAETWLVLKDWPRASVEADSLVENASKYGDAYLKARALELRARLAICSGKPETAERYLRLALETIARFDVPLVAWRIHATAWDVFLEINDSRAATHRSHAEAGVLDLARSLHGVESLQRSFLLARNVNRLLDHSAQRTTSGGLLSPLVQQS